uniref:NodB homology domain-containing protein n=1 Tax=Bicosoecida sp. CB-2014 TaxID=1486930 RepID=A0A7S1G8J3_9STRA
MAAAACAVALASDQVPCLPADAGFECTHETSCALFGWCGTGCFDEGAAASAGRSGAEVWCGDARCNGDESCESCADDCGPCQPRGRIDRCVRDGELALTFDDGPSEHTARLLDTLADKGVAAAFFFLGYAVDAMGAEGRALVARAAAEGHLVASHTYAHLDLSVMSEADLRADLARADEVLRAAACVRPRVLRAPQGLLSPAALELVQDLGYRVVHWNLDTRDWQHADDDPLEILRVAEETMEAEWPRGVISLQHDTRGPSVDLVDTIIDLARAKGYEIVPLERCISPNATACLPGLVYANSSCHAEAADSVNIGDGVDPQEGGRAVVDDGPNAMQRWLNEGWEWVTDLPLFAGIGVGVLFFCMVSVCVCCCRSAMKRKRMPQRLTRSEESDEDDRGRRKSPRKQRSRSRRSRRRGKSGRDLEAGSDSSGERRSLVRIPPSPSRFVRHSVADMKARRARAASDALSAGDLGAPPSQERGISLASLPGSVGDIGLDLGDLSDMSRGPSRAPSREPSVSGDEVARLLLNPPSRTERGRTATTPTQHARERSRGRRRRSGREGERRRRGNKKPRRRGRSGSRRAGAGSGSERDKSPASRMPSLNKSAPLVLESEPRASLATAPAGSGAWSAASNAAAAAPAAAAPAATSAVAAAGVNDASAGDADGGAGTAAPAHPTPAANGTAANGSSSTGGGAGGTSRPGTGPRGARRRTSRSSSGSSSSELSTHSSSPDSDDLSDWSDDARTGARTSGTATPSGRGTPARGAFAHG